MDTRDGKHAEIATSATARVQILAAAVLFSTGGAAIKGTTLAGWQVAGFRSGVAAATLLILLPACRRGWGLATFAVGTGYAATLTLFVLANKLTTAANTIFLQATAPLYIVLLGPWLLKEPVHRRDLGFLAVIAVGMAFFFVGAETPRVTAPDPATGNVLAALSGVTFALTMAGLRWVQRGSGRDSSPAASAVAVGNLLAFVFALPWALPLRGGRPADIAVILFLGVFQIALAYVLLTNALRHVPAFDASLLLIAEPVLNPLWAWAVHGEVPSVWSNAGGSLIIGATLVKAWIDSRTPFDRGRGGAAP